MQSSSIPIFLSKLNMARQGHFVSIKVEHTVMNLRLLEMFQEIGIIRGYHIFASETKIKVMLRYITGSFNIFFKIVQISKPGKKVYVDMMHLAKLKERGRENNIYIISTSKGIKFDTECVINKLGGEVLLKIVL